MPNPNPNQVASQEAFKEAATMDTLALEVARVRRARCEDAERWEAVEVVVAAPIERLKTIMAAAAGPPAPAARQPATAAAAAVPAALPRATRVAPSSPASHSVPFAPAASAARRSLRMADPEPPPGSNTARKRPKTWAGLISGTPPKCNCNRHLAGKSAELQAVSERKH